MHRLLSTGRLSTDLPASAVSVLPGAELGASLLPGAGDHLSSVFVLGAGNYVLRAPCALLPDTVLLPDLLCGRTGYGPVRHCCTGSARATTGPGCARNTGPESGAGQQWQPAL